MTPTPPSTAAGSDPRPALLASWLRRAARHPRAETLILRGSLLLGAWCPGAARPPADVDYLVLGDHDEAGTARLAAAVAATPDDGGPHLALEGTEPIWAETPFPGLRAHVVGCDGDAATAFHVDFAFGDPLSQPPRATAIAGVGPVLGCAPETLFAWKLHGLVEFGRGRWRAKDLYDLDLIWRSVPLSLPALRPAVELAFASRALPLSALDDFRTLDAWGRSRSSARKWRGLARKLPAGAVPDFFAVRARLRGAIDTILGAAAPVRAPAGP
jgi:hypothetical protein